MWELSAGSKRIWNLIIVLVVLIGCLALAGLTVVAPVVESARKLEADKIEIERVFSLIQRAGAEKALPEDRLKAAKELMAMKNHEQLVRMLFREIERLGSHMFMVLRTASARPPTLEEISQDPRSMLITVWNHHKQILASKNKERTGRLMLSLLDSAKSDYGRKLLVGYFLSNYMPAAEGPLLRLLKTPPVRDDRPFSGYKPYDLHLLCAHILIEHSPERCGSHVLDAAEAVEADPRLQRDFLDAYSRQQRRIKDQALMARYLRMAFGLMEKDKNAPDNKLRNHYYLALSVGGGLGVKFAPDEHLPRYQDERGNLTDAYFADTIRNALKWWEENKHSYQGKS